MRYLADPEAIDQLLPEVVKIANAEKHALGFLSEGAYYDASARRKLRILIDQKAAPAVAGFLLFGGVYPRARVQQIGVHKSFRRSGVASRLLQLLVEELERQGYLTLSARIAADLPGALEFYRSNGFEQIATKRGGGSRGREILLHERELQTPSLLTGIVPPRLRISVKKRLEAPLYAFDLNVLFDLVRNRQRHADAAALFAAALEHRIRLAITSEFTAELRRTSPGKGDDLLLQMALQLPLLPAIKSDLVKSLSEQILRVVFGEAHQREHTPQAESDASHLAHAALARATAFITSDEALLSAQPRLLKQFDVDVVSLTELLDVVAADIAPSRAEKGSIGSYVVDQPRGEDLASILIHYRLPMRDEISNEMTSSIALRHGEEPVAFGYSARKRHDDYAEIVVAVDPGAAQPAALVEFVMSSLIRIACQGGPVKLLLSLPASQPVVREVAKAQGFQPLPDLNRMAKVAIGRPITEPGWRKVTDLVRRRTGITLARREVNSSLVEVDDSVASAAFTLTQVEDALGPTIVSIDDRPAVIVPIAKKFADELLGTAPQLSLSFISRRPATLRNRRGYVNSRYRSGVMKPDAIIMFYESQRTGGRGAIVAAARIVDSVVVARDSLDESRREMLALDDLQDVSKSESLLFSTFDNLLPFPRPVGREALLRLGVDDRTKFISAVAVPAPQASAILDLGWLDE